MILETVLSETSQAQEYLRPLGSFEELRWQIKKRSLLPAAVAAHVDGTTTIGERRAMLDRRLCLLPTNHHPLPDFLQQIESTINLACTS